MALTAKLASEQRPEFQDPPSHRFVGDIQPTLSEQIFNVAIAERETLIEPNGMPDNVRRESVAKEIPMGNLTHERDVGGRWRDKIASKYTQLTTSAPAAPAGP